MSLAAGADRGLAHDLTVTVDALRHTVASGTDERSQILHAQSLAPKKRVRISAPAVGAAGDLSSIIDRVRKTYAASGESAQVPNLSVDPQHGVVAALPVG